jgi:gamma-glutamyl hercynylcysteine S-oxide hydrolase
VSRHLAWLASPGAAPASLHDLVLAPPFSLERQARAPRRQRHGTVNADGFGLGWYLPGRAEPVRFRRAQPIWSDASFASLAPTISTHSALAAVRSATPCYPATDESCVAPFTHGRWLFSHDGRVDGLLSQRWRLRHGAEESRDVQAPVDSAVVFGFALTAWLSGAGLGEGLVAAVDAAVDSGDDPDRARLTMLASDGERLAGITWGEGLALRRDGRGALLASEPSDDGTDWQDLPPHSLVEVDLDGVKVNPLPHDG